MQNADSAARSNQDGEEVLRSSNGHEQGLGASEAPSPPTTHPPPSLFHTTWPCLPLVQHPFAIHAFRILSLRETILLAAPRMFTISLAPPYLGSCFLGGHTFGRAHLWEGTSSPFLHTNITFMMPRCDVHFFVRCDVHFFVRCDVHFSARRAPNTRTRMMVRFWGITPR